MKTLMSAIQAALQAGRGHVSEFHYHQTGKVEELDEAISHARQAVDSTPQSYPSLSRMLYNLARKLEIRYRRTGRMEDIEEAIKHARQANNMAPEISPHRAGIRDGLATRLQTRYERTGRIEDLEEAIELSRQNVSQVAKWRPGYANHLYSLGNRIMCLYNRTGDSRSLEEALQIARQVYSMTSEFHPSFANRSNNLATKLQARFAQTAKIEDLEEALELSQQAVNMTTEGGPTLVGLLNDLGRKYELRYEYTGSAEDLEEGIRLDQRAIQILPSDHPNLAICVTNLGNKLQRRHERTEKIENLNEAIDLACQAVALTPEDHPELAGRLSNLGCRYIRRYGREGKTDDLEEGVRLARRGVEETPEDHPAFAGRLNNLAADTQLLYRHTQKMEDLEKAIDLSLQATSDMPEGHPGRPELISNLGSALGCRFGITKDITDLDLAIELTGQAINLTPADHPHIATMLKNHGHDLRDRYEHTKQPEDLEKAIQVARRAWECQAAIPFVRINASLSAINMLQIKGNLEEAYQLSKKALALLPFVHNRMTDRQDQQHIISHFSGLAPTICSLALATGQSAETASMFLEQGRGIILSLLIDDRSDISPLKRVNPELFERYEDLHAELNMPAKSLVHSHSHQDAGRSRTDVYRDFEICVRIIRRHPGFENFQKGLSIAEMQDCTRKGNIIFVNATELRSDAIIVTVEGFRFLPLSDSFSREAKEWIDQNLSETSQSDRGRKNRAYREFLSWLWRACVRPILNEIHCDSSPSDQGKPKIWWIGTGLASSFPFHAAGTFPVELNESAYCRVISSYTPTIKALSYSQRRCRALESTCSNDRNVLVIAMPKTPSAVDLPGAKLEMSEVTAVMNSFAKVDTAECPNVADTVARLSQYHIAHFACHGVSDPKDPSESGLVLQTASPETKELRQDLLSVRIASQAHLPRAEIAYLSSCSTAQNRVSKLSDEVLHVVSGFQIAGFRHSIGCLWPSDDKVCLKVAKSFYLELSQRNHTQNDDWDAASALQKAVAEVRESAEYRNRPLLWAQFVHFGA